MAHLLLVDDDDDIVELFSRFLRSEGHEVRSASTGEEGLQALRAAPLPDLLRIPEALEQPFRRDLNTDSENT
jgi:two-component system NtrC family response regulator/two-component system nitrogen regulation response regulator GlnG